MEVIGKGAHEKIGEPGAEDLIFWFKMDVNKVLPCNESVTLKHIMVGEQILGGRRHISIGNIKVRWNLN